MEKLFDSLKCNISQFSKFLYSTQIIIVRNRSSEKTILLHLKIIIMNNQSLILEMGGV